MENQSLHLNLNNIEDSIVFQHRENNLVRISYKTIKQTFDTYKNTLRDIVYYVHVPKVQGRRLFPLDPLGDNKFVYGDDSEVKHYKLSEIPFHKDWECKVELLEQRELADLITIINNSSLGYTFSSEMNKIYRKLEGVTKHDNY